MIERCRMFIINQFRIHDCEGIECELFHKMAREAHLVEAGEYGGPWSHALSELCDVESRYDMNGDWIYNIFKLKEA